MKIKSIFNKSLALILAVVMLVSVISVVLPVTASAKQVSCRYCYGSGRLTCLTCRGAGYNSCPNCYGTGYWTGYTGVNRCLRCSGTGRLICPNCQSRGYNVCTGCNGKGYYEDYSEYSSSGDNSSSSSSSSSKPATVAKPPRTAIAKIISREAGFSVSWKKQTKSVTGYQIQYATNSSFKNGKTKSVKGRTNTTVLNLTGGKKYFVRVRTFRTYNGKNYFSGWSGARRFVTKKVALPAKTTIAKIISRTSGFSVSWKKQTKRVTGYQVQFATNNKFTGGKTKSVKGKTNMTITGLLGAKKYYIRVRTFRTYAGKNYFSGWSPAKSVVTKVTLPGTTVIDGIDEYMGGSFRIYFRHVNNCTGYQLHISKYSDFRADKQTKLYTCPISESNISGNRAAYEKDGWKWYLPPTKVIFDAQNSAKTWPWAYSVGNIYDGPKLDIGTTYYLRMRSYKVVNGKNYYSSWTKTKTALAIPFD